MSFYPVYRLEVYDDIQGKWIQVAHLEASNRPHYYDTLHVAFERLVANATDGPSPNQAPIGYRIVKLRLAEPAVVDCWTNGKIASEGQPA